MEREIKKGELIVISAGEWDDYGVMFIGTVLKDFKLLDIETELRESGWGKPYFDDFSVVRKLQKEGYIEPLKTTNVYIDNIARNKEWDEVEPVRRIVFEN